MDGKISFIPPFLSSVFTALFTNIVKGQNLSPPKERRSFYPGQTVAEQIAQVSREDPIYGAIVKGIQTGQAQRSFIYSGGDPYTTYAVMTLAQWIRKLITTRPEPKQPAPIKSEQLIGRSGQQFFGPDRTPHDRSSYDFRYQH